MDMLVVNDGFGEMCYLNIINFAHNLPLLPNTHVPYFEFISMLVMNTVVFLQQCDEIFDGKLITRDMFFVTNFEQPEHMEHRT